jgi:hypothetical protein
MNGRPLAETVGGLVPPADDPHMWELLHNVINCVEADTQGPNVTRETLREQWRRFVREGGVPWLKARHPGFKLGPPTGFVPAQGSRPERKADA